MTCPQCPHCQLGVEKGGLTLSDLSLSPGEQNKNKIETPKLPVRGKAREYSQAFELVWKAYVRREQKLEAFGVWLVMAKGVGGETQLATLCLGALRWQRTAWAATWKREGKNVAPYLERYLKRRKWEDEPMPDMQAVPRRVDDGLAASTSRKIAEINQYADRRPTAQELAELAALRRAKG